MKRIALGALVALVLTLAAAAIAATTIELTQDQLNKICDQNPAQCNAAKQSPVLVCTPPAVLNASGTVCVAAGSSSGPAGAPWNGTCTRTEADISGVPVTVSVPTKRLTLDWNNQARLYTSPALNGPGFAAGDMLVIDFTTGNVSTTNSIPSVRLAEYQSGQSSRLGVLSETPCDLTKRPGAYSESKSITLAFALGTGNGFGFYPVLKLNTRYYVNVINTGGDCTVCDVFVDLVKPGGL